MFAHIIVADAYLVRVPERPNAAGVAARDKMHNIVEAGERGAHGESVENR